MAKKKKVVAPQEPAQRLIVDIDSCCEFSERSSEKWGSWKEIWSNYFRGVYLNLNGDGYAGEPIDFHVEIGDVVYVIWAEWSSGDSFGHGENNRCEALQIYKTQEKAVAALKAFKQATGYSTKIANESGETIDTYCGWHWLF